MLAPVPGAGISHQRAEVLRARVAVPSVRMERWVQTQCYADSVTAANVWLGGQEFGKDIQV